MTQLRRDQVAGWPLHRPRGGIQVPSARPVAALFPRRPGDLTVEKRAYLERLQHIDATTATTCRLTQNFAAMVRGRPGARLEP